MPLSAPDNVQVMVHNSTLAEVHWEPVSSPSVRGKLQGYKVLFDTDEGCVMKCGGWICRN